MVHHPLADEFSIYLRQLQSYLCQEFEQVDGGGVPFKKAEWQREGGGGGLTRVLTDSEVFEKAGVNYSEVFGELSPEFASTLPGDGTGFYATGLSLVIHPRSPMIPTVHANFRFIVHGTVAWFGGGADLTPYYFWHEDAISFHSTWKSVCDRYEKTAYRRFKAECDRYFFLPHREETRGVGGIFFDYLKEDLDRTLTFVKEAGREFAKAYLPIVQRRRNEPWGPDERLWQEIRRGRYAEFNLIYDRGTLFGLKTGGRTESILMSLPPMARWVYDHCPAPGSREAELLAQLRPQDWLDLGSLDLA